MSLSVFTDPVSRVVESAMDGVALRQRVVATNLANSATPGYRAQSVTFEDQLANAVDSQGAGFDATSLGQVGVVKDAGTPVQADGNSVDVSRETMLLGETELNFQALVGALNFRQNIVKDALSR